MSSIAISPLILRPRVPSIQICKDKNKQFFSCTLYTIMPTAKVSMTGLLFGEIVCLKNRIEAKLSVQENLLIEPYPFSNLVGTICNYYSLHIISDHCGQIVMSNLIITIPISLRDRHSCLIPDITTMYSRHRPESLSSITRNSDDIQLSKIQAMPVVPEMQIFKAKYKASAR